MVSISGKHGRSGEDSCRPFWRSLLCGRLAVELLAVQRTELVCRRNSHRPSAHGVGEACRADGCSAGSRARTGSTSAGYPSGTATHSGRSTWVTNAIGYEAQVSVLLVEDAL